MGIRGPAPKPTRMKLLEGNPGKRALPKNEAQPEQRMPTCPAHLNAEAKREWKRMGRELHRLGLLTVVDRAAFAAYCMQWARWVEAEQHLQRDEVKLVYQSANGMWRQNPWISVANDAMRGMHTFLSEFGMTPSARTRIQVEKQEKVENPLEALMQRSRASASG